MRIGIDARLWNESGVGRYTRNLVFELAKIDKKNKYCLFVSSKDTEEILKQVQNDSFKIVKVDIRWHTIEEQLKFPKILNKEHLDLVHFPYFSVPLFYNKPFVVTIHDLILHHFPTGQASTLPPPFYWTKHFGYKFVIAQAAKRAKKVIAVSQTTKDEIVKHLEVPREKIVVTYEGIDVGLYSSSKAQRSREVLLPGSSRRSSNNTKYFLYVGNAYPHKNLERLIEAFSLFCHPERNEGSHFVRDSSPLAQNDTRLILVGKEDYFYKKLKEKVKKMKLEDSIVFFGEATDQELMNLYKNAIALIAPSLMEGFGLPVLEAMSNKCLVLCSNIPAHREIAQDAAIYFDPQSRDDLTDKLKAIHSNDMYSPRWSFGEAGHYSENIRKGIERAKMFSWEKMAKETLSVYESSIGVR